MDENALSGWVRQAASAVRLLALALRRQVAETGPADHAEHGEREVLDHPLLLVGREGVGGHREGEQPEVAAGDNVRYYADFVTNPREWGNLVMTDAISPLRDKNNASYRLIKRW
jgi:hypothetical protein